MPAHPRAGTAYARGMRIAVTGGSGKLGRHVVERLRAHGHDVVVLDTHGVRGSGWISVDLTDYGQVVDALGGVQGEQPAADAVVHLAAIPAPGLHADVATFRNNMVTTFNVLHAVTRLGITKVVMASSETVLGLPFDTPPPYVPVDEGYPARPESVYSLGKHLEETMAVELCRWHPALSITALRFSNVMDVEDYAQFPAFDADPSLRRWNLWGYIDGRDGAQAVEKALATHRAGVRPLRHRVTRHRDEPPQRRPRRRGVPRTSRCAVTSASTTRCCPSTRLDGCSGSIRGTRGVTRSEAAPAARQDGRMVSVAPPPRLVELAHAHGVATEYWDWQGQHVTVSAAAIRAVLTALGIEAEGDDAVERALADAELAPWRRTLPATVVSRDGWTPWVHAHVQAGTGIRLDVVLEDGTVREVPQIGPVGARPRGRRAPGGGGDLRAAR